MALTSDDLFTRHDPQWQAGRRWRRLLSIVGVALATASCIAVPVVVLVVIVSNIAGPAGGCGGG